MSDEFKYNPLTSDMDLVGDGGGGGGGTVEERPISEALAALREDLNGQPKVLGDVECKGIDTDDIPKICGYPMWIVAGTAPNRAPDFIGQVWIDKTNKHTYGAVGVEKSSDFLRTDN